MGDPKVELKLSLDNSRFLRGLKGSEEAVANFGSKAARAMSGLGHGLDVLDSKIGGFGQGLALVAGGYGLKEFVGKTMEGGFALTRLGILAGLSAKQLAGLKDSVYEVAKAMPGVDVSSLMAASAARIREGANYDDVIAQMQLTGKTASILGADVGNVGEVIQKLHETWGVNTSDQKQLAVVLDQVATAARKGHLSMEALPDLFKQSALGAKSAGATLPEYLAMADAIAGVTGSAEAANPILSRFFVMMSSKSGVKTMGQLGVHLQDAQHHMRPFVDVFGDFVKKVSSLPDMQQQMLFPELGGARGAAYFKKLAEELDNIKKRADEIKNGGTLTGENLGGLQETPEAKWEKFKKTLFDVHGVQAKVLDNLSNLLGVLNAHSDAAIKTIYGVGTAMLGLYAIMKARDFAKTISEIFGAFGGAKGSAGAGGALGGVSGAVPVYVTNWGGGPGGAGGAAGAPGQPGGATGAGGTNVKAGLLGGVLGGVTGIGIQGGILTAAGPNAGMGAYAGAALAGEGSAAMMGAQVGGPLGAAAGAATVGLYNIGKAGLLVAEFGMANKEAAYAARRATAGSKTLADKIQQHYGFDASKLSESQRSAAADALMRAQSGGGGIDAVIKNLEAQKGRGLLSEKDLAALTAALQAQQPQLYLTVNVDKDGNATVSSTNLDHPEIQGSRRGTNAAPRTGA
jgi:hypothetical protein